MDTAKLVSTIQQELERQKDDGIALLSLQNHIYGCFIVMEDIAQGILQVEEGVLVGNAFHLELESQFPQIGIRYYGFVMDGKAIYESHSEEYKEEWIKLFQEGNEMEKVDQLEDQIIQLLSAVETEQSYFLNALEHDGNLSPDWVERVLHLLHPAMKGRTSVPVTVTVRRTEKMIASKKIKVNHLSTTRRHRAAPPVNAHARYLSTTRRALKH